MHFARAAKAKASEQRVAELRKAISETASLALDSYFDELTVCQHGSKAASSPLPFTAKHPLIDSASTWMMHRILVELSHTS